MNHRLLGVVVIAASTISVIGAVGAWIGSDDVDAPTVSVRRDAPSLLQLEQIGSGLAAASEARQGGGFLQMQQVTPRGLTPEQWQVLQDEFDGHPRAAEELGRIADYFSSKADFDEFDAIRTQNPGDRRLAEIARRLLPQVDLHLQRGELPGGEAVALRAELLEYTESDDTRRADDMARWLSRQAAMVPAAAPPDPSFIAYKRAEEEVIAQFKALPESQQDPAALAQRVQALRRGER